MQWNEFRNIVSSAFGDLRNDGDLTDVTLVCEDGKQIEAHMVVLSATSPFFLDLLKRNKHPHPLIYMKGIKSENLVAMVDFFYRGEANVAQDNLNDFLALADEMRLKGLNRQEEPRESLEKAQKSQTQNYDFEQISDHGQNSKIMRIHQMDTEKSPEKNSNTLSLINSVKVKDVQLLDAQINSMMEKGKNRVMHGKLNGKEYYTFTMICKLCGKEGKQNVIKAHIEAKHITGITYTCEICGNIAKTKQSLRVHKSLYHREEIH